VIRGIHQAREPVFDSLEADPGEAMLSIPATKGFGSAPALQRRGCGAHSTMIHLRCALEKYGQRQTSPEVSKAALATAKTFIFRVGHQAAGHDRLRQKTVTSSKSKVS